MKKNFFFRNCDILFEAKENLLNSFKSNAFLIENSTPYPTLNPTLDPSICYIPKQTRVQSRISKVKIWEKISNSIKK